MNNEKMDALATLIEYAKKSTTSEVVDAVDIIENWLHTYYIDHE